jgi:hypothetical protein
MSSRSSGHWPVLGCALVLTACGGGGGGSTPPPPPPAADTTPPDTALSSTPATVTASANETFTASSTEAGSVFEASVDGGAYAAVAATFTLSNLAQGAHTVNVRARDSAGNVDASPVAFTWIVDTLAPDTTVVSSPVALSSSASGTFSFGADEPAATFQVSLDGAAFAAAQSPYVFSALTNGSHTFAVRAIDAAGNVDATPASFNWQIDASQPSARITFPTKVSYTDANQLHVRGTTSDGNTITGVTVNGVAATSTDAFAHWSALVPIAAGNNNLVVSVTDSFGNTNANAASAEVANRGVALTQPGGLVLDAANARVLTADRGLDAIVALSTSDGHATILSDGTRGTGPTGGFEMVGLAPTGHAVVLGAGEVLDVNLTTGNRTVIPTGAAGVDTTFFYRPICNTPCTRIYAIANRVPPGQYAVFSVDLNTGARTVISGGNGLQGTGPAIQVPRGIALDPIGTPRLLIADDGLDAVLAVDLATGDRTVLSSGLAPNVSGAGPAIGNPEALIVDTVNNRVLIANKPVLMPNELIAVSLTNGNRTLLPVTGTSTNFQSTQYMAMDSANSRLLLAIYPRANVAQVNLTTNQLTRFADSYVGTGPMIAGGSVLIDDSTPSRSLITSSLGGVTRVELGTGARTTIVATDLVTPQYLQFDTRPGVPANRLFYANGASTSARLYSADPATGSRTLLSVTSIPSSPRPELPLDAENSRLLINVEPAFSQSQIVPIDVLTGTRGTVLADSSIGTPPFGALNAMALDNSPGQPQRIIGMSQQTLYEINTTTGGRNVASSNAGPGSGPSLAHADALAINATTRHVLATSSYHTSLQDIDLTTGNRTMVSGRNLDDQTIRGTGPWIRGLWSRIAADFDEQVAYVTTNSDAILAIDLISGDRVLTAR